MLSNRYASYVDVTPSVQSWPNLLPPHGQNLCWDTLQSEIRRTLDNLFFYNAEKVVGQTNARLKLRPSR